ncbi:hypothetical protein Tco_1008149, partial [Tanacetum coccineum]
MENYEEVVTLACRSRLSFIHDIRDIITNTPREQLVRDTYFGWLLDIDESRENGILIHFMSCCQVESVDEARILFIITSCPIPFRRGVFESCMDGKHITARMLLAKINSEEFNTMHDDDVVSLCLLAILQLVLLGPEPKEPDSGPPKYSLSGFTWDFKRARPSPRLTPDAFEDVADWWVSSRSFFDGHIREPPRIPPR